jgi:hypothetical protein
VSALCAIAGDEAAQVAQTVQIADKHPGIQNCLDFPIAISCLAFVC